jgi:hypothetical protein
MNTGRAHSFEKPKVAFVIHPRRHSRPSVAPDATLRIDGRVVPHAGNSFQQRIKLKLGRNVLELTASRVGSAPESRSLIVERLKPSLPLRLSSKGGTVFEDELTIRGVTVPGAKVTIRGAPAAMSGPRFAAQVRVRPGRNLIFIRAVHPRYAPAGRRLLVVRRLTAAERQAIAEQKQQDFINSTTSISYAQLSKNADRYSGSRVRYYGEILQIQEDALGGFMLLSVTDLGYDVWTDNIWVNYDGNIQSVEGLASRAADFAAWLMSISRLAATG